MISMKRIALLICLTIFGLTACATHTIRENVVAHYDLDIKLRSEKKWFGNTIPYDYGQPIQISSQQLENILGGIEIDVRKSDSATIRQRRNALSSKLLMNISESLPKAFAEASPNQQIIVMAQRKQMQKGIFNRKYLTSFTTYVQGEYLYVFLSRVEWKVETTNTTPLPEPWPGETVMPFETVASPGYQKVGKQGVRVAWQSQAFGPSSHSTTPLAAETGITPGVASTPSPSAPQRDESSPSAKSRAEPTPTAVPNPDVAAAGPTDPVGSTVPGVSTEHSALKGLSSQDLRDLADLEDAYQGGRMDRGQYLREKKQILDRGN